MIAALGDDIEAGRVKVFTVGSNGDQSFYNRGAHPAHRSWMQRMWDEYIRWEVIPFIHSHCQGTVSIATMGASLGLLLAIQLIGVAAGTYDLPVLFNTWPQMTELANLPLNLPVTTIKAIAFWAFAIAFALKVPVWPFHTWLPDAHTEAPTAGSMILGCGNRGFAGIAGVAPRWALRDAGGGRSCGAAWSHAPAAARSAHARHSLPIHIHAIMCI